MSKEDQVTGIVLAGGKSTRFGTDKGFELFGPESLIERAVSLLDWLEKLIVVTSAELAQRIDALRLPARTVLDVKTGLGPMAGIHAGLLASSTRHSLVVACDMPFLNRHLLEYMIGLRQGYDMVVPRVSGLPEHLHAVYSRDCLPAIERKFAQGRSEVHALVDGVRVRFVEQAEVDRFDPQHLSFFNVNSKTDMDRARRLVNDMAAAAAKSREGGSKA